MSDLGWDCHCMMHNYVGQWIKKGNFKFNDDTPINFNMYGIGREPYCKELWRPMIDKVKPDVFGILLDTFFIFPWAVGFNFAPAKAMFYYPSDGGKFPINCENILKTFPYSVAMSQFGQKQVKELYNLDYQHIPHGTDTKLFYPLSKEQKLQLRHNYRKEKGIDLIDKFVVGVVARNQGRKMLDRTIKSFYLLAKKVPNAVLLLHMDMYDPAGVFDIYKLITELKLNNRVFSTGFRYFDAIDYTKMNELYNLFDCFFLSTSGEGFGIPIIEAMSCGIPVLATDYTTTPEIVQKNDAGMGIKLIGTENLSMHELMHDKGHSLMDIDTMLINGTITGGWNVERGVIDCNDAANKLQHMYDNPDLMVKFSRNARKTAENIYSWDVVIKQWQKHFEHMRDV